MFVAPVLPSLAISDATRQVLSKVTSGPARPTNVSGSITGTSGSADVAGPVARSPGSTDISGPVAGSAWSADVTWSIARSPGLTNVAGTIAWLARTSDVPRSITWLTRSTDVTGPIPRLSGASDISSTARPRGQSRCEVAAAWTPCFAESSARPVLQEFSRRAACQRAAGGSKTRTQTGAARSSRWPICATNAATGRQIEEVLQIAIRRKAAAARK